ncbi:MAG: IPT/TIG domain-containing protein, partial [Candidatus Acidiferrales bacterium]
NSGQVTATIPAADIATGSTASVTVFNPAPGGGTTSAQTFTVNNPIPILTSAVPNPNPIPVGATGAMLTLNGSGFVPSSVVRWGGSNRTTTFVNSTQLQATIPASDLVNAGTTSVTVFNPAPTGGTSSGQNVSVVSPAIASLNPDVIPATNPTFMLTVNGSNFHSGSVVRWKGSNLPTTFVNGGMLTATVDSLLVINPGLAQITVFNSGGTGGVSDPSIFTVDNRNPLPTVTALMPSAVLEDDPMFTLVVIGSNFVPSSKVRWNGSERTTMFVSGMELWATIPASDIAAQGTASITVVTPSPGGGTSNIKSLPIQTAPNPPPTTTSPLMPNSIVAGTERDTLTVEVNGSGFVNGSSVVRWNGMNRLTSFMSPTQLTATIPASDLLSAGTAMVTVFTSAPGGGTSNAQAFTINNPAPLLSSISPIAAVQGSPGFTLTVVGANFVPGSVVLWNGSSRMTTFIGNNQLRAAIPASDVSSAGGALVTVFTPAPVGGTSAAQMFTISNSVLAGSAQGGSLGTTSAGTVDGGSEVGTTSAVTARASEPSVGGTLSRNPGDGAQATQRPPAVLVAHPGLVPVVSQAEASRAASGSAEVTVKVLGRNFLRGAIVRWNGEDLETTYVGTGELRAVLPATLAASPASGNITVVNPEPTGLESFPFELVLR